MRREVLFAVVFVVVLSSTVSAAEITTEAFNSTLMQVLITDAVDLYAYEVNLSIDSGTVGTVTTGSFIGTSGSQAVYGSNQKNGYLYIYGSRLDSSGGGIDGDGVLANISHSGELTLKGALFVDSDEVEESKTYNAESGGDDSGNEDSGSSGGGGAPAVQENRNIVVTPSNITLNVIENIVQEKEITILNNGADAISVEITTEGLGDSVTLSETEIQLASGEEKNILLEAFVSERGLIAGKIIFKQNGLSIKEVPVVINVRSENFLFDAKVSLNQRGNLVKVGDNLEISVDLLQVGPEEKVDVVANYIIKDYSGNILVEESETFYVLGQKNVVRKVNTEGLPPGDYVLGLEIIYPGAFAVSSTQFKVVENKGFFGIEMPIIIALSIALFVGVIVIIWALTRRKNVVKMRKRY